MSHNARRVIVDGPIGVGKSTLLRKYYASFANEQVTAGPFGSRIIRPPEGPPILVLPEPSHRCGL